MTCGCLPTTSPISTTAPMRSTARLPARSANRRQSTHSAGTGSRYLLISDRTPAPTADAGSGARAAAGAWYALAVLLLKTARGSGEGARAQLGGPALPAAERADYTVGVDPPSIR